MYQIIEVESARTTAAVGRMPGTLIPIKPNTNIASRI
jgi:hypothetical protein